jgi:hypothetical protein
MLKNHSLLIKAHPYMYFCFEIVDLPFRDFKLETALHDIHKVTEMLQAPTQLSFEVEGPRMIASLIIIPKRKCKKKEKSHDPKQLLPFNLSVTAGRKHG